MGSVGDAVATGVAPGATGQVSQRDPDSFVHRTVQDLFSLHGRTVVITGGARGIGLAFGFAVAEVGGSVAIIDVLDEPHEHFYKLQKEYNVKVKMYRCDDSGVTIPSSQHLSDVLQIGCHELHGFEGHI